MTLCYLILVASRMEKQSDKNGVLSRGLFVRVLCLCEFKCQ